jgi:deoxyhypusine synthase
MPYVRQMKLKPGMRVSKIADEMHRSGVLGPRRFADAVQILTTMFRDKRYTNIMAIAGPMVPGGLRELISDLVSNRRIHALTMTGANVTHDLVEALGHRHQIGTEESDDQKLKEHGLYRIYDIYISQRAIEAVEKFAHKAVTKIDEEKRRNIAPWELLHEIGKQLRDPASILWNASKRNVPVFCPGLHDSMLGVDLWTYGQLKPLYVNPARDFSKIVELTYESNKIGLIILGGGMPKHFTLLANTFRGGLDAAVQFTMDRPEPGGLSGAPLEEAVSWGKIKAGSRTATVIGDAATLFPLACIAALEKAA